MRVDSPGGLTASSVARDLAAAGVGQGGRRRRSVLAVLLTSAALSVALLADASHESASASRLDRLRAWIDAVEAHTPGRIDAPLDNASRWLRADLLSLRVDLSVLYLLVDDPSLRRVRFVPSEELRRLLADASPVPLMLAFNEQVLDQMRPVAQRVRAAGPGRIAKRGVVLHTDLVTRLFPDSGDIATRSSVSRTPPRWRVTSRRTRPMSRGAGGAAARRASSTSSGRHAAGSPSE